MSSSSSPFSLSPLCTLFNNCLLPHIEAKAGDLTKEKEKELLILLSQLLRKIKSWAHESHSNLADEIVLGSPSSWKCCNALGSAFGEGHDCLANVTCILVHFLSVENKFIQHTAGNILVVISSFLVKSGSDLKNFLQVLFATLEAIVLRFGSPVSTGHNIFETERAERRTHCFSSSTYYDIERFSSVSAPKLLNENLLRASSLVQVLRKILKSLRTDYSELAEEHLHSFGCPLQHMLWELFHENRSDKDSVINLRVCSADQKDIFLAAMLQLLCSIAHQNDLEEVNSDTFYELAFLTEIASLVPSLLHWCFFKHENYKESTIWRYLKHKMLMLMIRLTPLVRYQCSVIVLWLQLLKQYFEDILCQPLSGFHDDINDSLEGSPFLVCTTYGAKGHSIGTRHLQRQAILLLFKCSFSMANFVEETGKRCPCTGQEHDGRKGLSELFGWLQKHLPPGNFLDSDNCLKSCSSFALSFLQLYMDEDNFLFEMLLLLSSIPSAIMPVQLEQNGDIIEEVKGDALQHILSVFNPVHLFHLFLAELCYDHVLLLDYLISSDSGVCCAQYLLRSLRLVRRSWHVFVEFSLCGSEINLTGKKKNVCSHRLDSHGKVGLLSIKKIRNSDTQGKRKRRRKDVCSMAKAVEQHAFENAKGCLLSLKESVENLYQKNLFPYNPSAFLRSLNRFKELCELQEKENHPKIDASVA